MPYKKKFKRCIICGKPFSNHHDGKTCSPKCRYAETQHFLGRVIPKEEIARNQAARNKHPVTGPFRTNCHAKYWSLTDSCGDVYRFTNLSFFVRQNVDLFQADDAKTGYLGRRYASRAGCQLKRLRPDGAWPIGSWKGWRWHFILKTPQVL